MINMSDAAAATAIKLIAAELERVITRICTRRP